MVLANCLSWTSYSLYVSDPYIFLSSAPGVMLGLYLFATGLQYGTPSQRKELEITVLTSSFIVLVSAALISMSISSREKAERLALSIGTFFSFMYYLAPLSTIRRVFRTRSAASICAPMSFMGLINSALWFSYGMGIGSPTLAIPNGFGALLSLLQLIIVFVFRNGSVVEPLIEEGERYMKFE
jgi:solute carrier family 50 (sugar transporter)